jgi:hypothetical protein
MKLGPVPVGLFKVVADELLELGHTVSEGPIEPIGEALVEVGPSPLQHAAVRGVS